MSDARGFTLIEALIALAILGLSSAVLFKVISDNLDRARRAQDETLAMARVQSLLAQGETAPVAGEEDGRYPDGATWRIAVSPHRGARAAWPVDAVDIAATVSWRSDGVEHTRTLTALKVVAKAGP